MKLIKYVAIHWLIIISVSVIVNGCSSNEINHFREAQRTFSDTASKENGLSRMQQPQLKVLGGGMPSAEMASISAGYASVIASLDSLTPAQVNKLQQTQLWGNVLLLKAMAYWRLQKYDQAYAIQQQAEPFKAQLGPRDQALLTALPGLVENDQAYEVLQRETGRQLSLTDSQQLQQSFVFAMDRLGAARRHTPGNNPVHQYLLLSQLGAYKNLSEACRLNNETKKACRQTKRCGAIESYDALAVLLKAQNISVMEPQMLLGLRPRRLNKARKRCQR